VATLDKIKHNEQRLSISNNPKSAKPPEYHAPAMFVMLWPEIEIPYSYSFSTGDESVVVRVHQTLTVCLLTWLPWNGTEIGYCFS
jgi:hypothetical protein